MVDFTTERYIVVALDQGGIPDKLTFTCKQNSGASTGSGFKVYQSATNGNWSVVSEPGLSGTLKTLHCDTCKDHKIFKNSAGRATSKATTQNKCE